MTTANIWREHVLWLFAVHEQVSLLLFLLAVGCFYMNFSFLLYYISLLLFCGFFLLSLYCTKGIKPIRLGSDDVILLFGVLSLWLCPCHAIPKRTKVRKAVFVFSLRWERWNACIRLHPTEGGNLNCWTNYQSVNLYGHKEPPFVNQILDITRKCTTEIVETAPTTT